MQKRKYPLSSDEFREIYSKVPKLAIEVLVIQDDGVVLTKRVQSSWNGYWHIPGATLYYKESVKDCVGRVGREELGVSLEGVKFLKYLEYPSEEKMRGFGWSVGLIFTARTSGPLPGKNAEGEEVRVFHKLPTKLVEEHRDLLARLLSMENG